MPSGDGPVERAHERASYNLAVEGTGPLAVRLGALAPGGSAAGRTLPVFCQDRLDYAAALEANRNCTMRLRDAATQTPRPFLLHSSECQRLTVSAC